MALPCSLTDNRETFIHFFLPSRFLCSVWFFLPFVRLFCSNVLIRLTSETSSNKRCRWCIDVWYSITDLYATLCFFRYRYIFSYYIVSFSILAFFIYYIIVCILINERFRRETNAIEINGKCLTRESLDSKKISKLLSINKYYYFVNYKNKKYYYIIKKIRRKITAQEKD